METACRNLEAEETSHLRERYAWLEVHGFPPDHGMYWLWLCVKNYPDVFGYEIGRLKFELDADYRRLVAKCRREAKALED